MVLQPGQTCAMNQAACSQLHVILQLMLSSCAPCLLMRMHQDASQADLLQKRPWFAATGWAQ